MPIPPGLLVEKRPHCCFWPFLAQNPPKSAIISHAKTGQPFNRAQERKMGTSPKSPYPETTNPTGIRAYRCITVKPQEL